MHKRAVFIFGIGLFSLPSLAQSHLDLGTALSMSRLPLKCLHNEYPNKTSHLADSDTDAVLKPHELHPAFYGCLDWHSCVHGHWMLVKILEQFPLISNRDSILQALASSFEPNKIQAEADYFGKYTASNTYERTYGWAWLLKLDNELKNWDDTTGLQWHAILQPLTRKIVALWKDYLSKQNYPSRIGMHANTAFGLTFALEWARANKDTAFEKSIVRRARKYFLLDKNIPAYLEPDATDFFSPSLEEADLMGMVLPRKQYAQWLTQFYSAASLQQISELPQVGDRKDYMMVHLDGLSFSRAWCMKHIVTALPAGHPLRKIFAEKAQYFLRAALPQIEKGGYGGEHWLATFAVYALTEP